MQNDIVEVFTEINDLFSFGNKITKPCSNIRDVKLQPYLQGNIDNLCGIYSLINATRLVIYPSKIKPEQLSRCVSVLSQKKQASNFIGTVKNTYKNYEGVSNKMVNAYQASKKQVQCVQRYGVSRTVVGQKSIYAPRPSETVTKKVSELKRKFFGGSIYD